MESSLPSPAQDEGTGRRTARALLTGDFGLSLCASRGTRRTRRLRRLQGLGLGPRWRTTVQHSYANEMRRIRHTPRSVSSMQRSRWGFEAKCSVSSCIGGRQARRALSSADDMSGRAWTSHSMGGASASCRDLSASSETIWSSTSDGSSGSSRPSPAGLSPAVGRGLLRRRIAVAYVAHVCVSHLLLAIPW